MRVLQITAFSGWGCTGRIAVGIHNALIGSGHESVIAWGRTNTAPRDIKTIKIGNKLDQQVHGLYTRLTDKCGFGSKYVTKEFLKAVDEYKPDLIQLHIMHGYYINLEILFNYIKSHNIPVVWTFHDCWAFTGHCPYFTLIGCEKWISGCHDCPQKRHHPASWGKDNSQWNWGKKKELYGSYPLMTVVTPSNWLASLVKRSFFYKVNVEVINNGVDLTLFKPTFSNYFDEYKKQNKIIVLGVSSTWVESKGLNDFLLIANLLGEKYQVVLVGLSEHQIKHLPINILGISRTDSIDELSKIYTAASVFVNPTYEDNYPTTNLESLACGTPVITYNTGGSSEPVTESGFGKVVEQGNVKKMVDAIIEQCKDLPEKKKLYNCDASNNYRKYVELFERMELIHE